MDNKDESSRANPSSRQDFSSRRSSWRGQYYREHRPPWWPENEEWPPRRWRHRQVNPFFRRLGCLFVLFNLFLILIFGLFVGTVINLFDRGANLSQPLVWLVPVGLVFVIIIFGFAFWAARNIRRMSTPLDELVGASNKVAE